MKQIILIFSVLLLSFNLSAQKKTYIYLPEVADYNKVNLLEGDTVSLCIKDYRVISPNSKVKCTFEQIAEAIRLSLIKTYHKAVFVSCDFVKEPSISIEIDVKSYDVSFYTGMWHAQTRYIVKIEKGEKEKKEDIEQINRNFNTLGFKTSKGLLDKCFTNSILKLTEVINNSLN